MAYQPRLRCEAKCPSRPPRLVVGGLEQVEGMTAEIGQERT